MQISPAKENLPLCLDEQYVMWGQLQMVLEGPNNDQECQDILVEIKKFEYSNI